MEEGIPSFVLYILNFVDFGDVNVDFQTTTIQLGLHQACYEMKEIFYEALDLKNVLHSYPDTQLRIVDHFYDLITHKYSLFSVLEGDKLVIQALKEKLNSLDLLSKYDDSSFGN
ncbi:unnamed protein product [Lactuca saligna]|uniref:Uncharacterized protein n=1 Tax=Lactuca saligna TaxID=75948 RepID=A0AA36E9V6_LACSI|nr:unnamed protein product [Lactuca saligna]